ncbi:hypothetical protein LNKW23_46400 [Paralimibaculum aggregatum]|uniref:Glycosyltransferase 2-like domain-containing protein n=1 Tax=Paralimibaculum aggregatum TaxID=3036245 RepID=A0ABQ6LTJ9_9RHOB|nr:glycosyltransferase [Limibaculum sp. NKW23]GMG85420.1 hypothetical protein LNKW23_46400 [Limibaculum sp. NKW23]
MDILLATYNGAARIGRQLASLAAQTYPGWHLLVRDDGSTDGTVALVEAFAAAHPGRVTILRDDRGNLRTLGNFAALLAQSDAPYCGFCDQDDIWDPDKLETAIRAMQALEAGHPPGRPALVVTDRRVVDETGRALAASFWEHQGVQPRRVRGFASFLAYPVAAGSSMLLNAALRARALPIPAEAIQYDCWVELVAAQFAATRYLEGARLTYIRHSGNVSGGGRAYPAGRYLRRAGALAGNLGRQRRVYRRYIAQARAFLALHGDAMPEPERRRLAMFVAMEGAVWPLKLWRGLRSGGLPPTPERKLAFLLLA